MRTLTPHEINKSRILEICHSNNSQMMVFKHHGSQLLTSSHFVVAPITTSGTNSCSPCKTKTKQQGPFHKIGVI